MSSFLFEFSNRTHNPVASTVIYTYKDTVFGFLCALYMVAFYLRQPARDFVSRVVLISAVDYMLNKETCLAGQKRTWIFISFSSLFFESLHAKCYF